jgi:hypothetical protein
VAWAIDKDGKNIYQLARGYAKSFKEWIDIFEALKIPTKNIAIDGGHWLDEVLDAAAANWKYGRDFKQGRRTMKEIQTWTILRGNGLRRSFKHEDGIYRVFAPASQYHRSIQIEGKPFLIKLDVIEWSNLSVKDQMFAIRRGGPGKPILHILPREKLNAQTLEMEKGSKTYASQVSNEFRTRKNNRDFWEESDPNVHYNDCDCQGVVQCGRGGYIGHIAALPEEVTAV